MITVATPTTKKNKSGRVYFFIEVDSENKKDILKIGKSSDKNGLAGTIGFYVNTLSGTPSITRYSVHNLIYRKLQENKKVLVYCKFSNSIKTKIKGIFEEHESEIPLDMTYVEELCLTEYHKNYLRFPEWNFQESNTQIPFDLLDIFIRDKNSEIIEYLFSTYQEFIQYDNSFDSLCQVKGIEVSFLHSIFDKIKNEEYKNLPNFVDDENGVNLLDHYYKDMN